MSANDLTNFWEQTILKWPFSGHFKYEKCCDIYVTQKNKAKKQDHAYRRKCEDSHMTRITHDKFRRNKIQNSQLAVIFNCFFLISSEILHNS